MKKNHLLAFVVMFFGLSMVLASSYVAAQDAENGSKQVKVKIEQNVNGEVKTVEKTFSAEDEAAIEELLKEFDINLNPDDLNSKQQVEINIRKTTEKAEDNDKVVINVERVHGDGDLPAKAFLGVYTEKIAGAAPTQAGVVITEVVPGSAAEAAGLQKGDVILKVDDKAIADPDQLFEAIRSHKPQDAINVRVLRDGKEQDMQAVLKEKKLVREFHFMPHEGFEWNGRAPHMKFFDGSETGQPGDRPFLGIIPGGTAEQKGVVVGEVVEESAAQKMGLQKGDVITKLNDKAVTDFGTLREALSNMKAGDEVQVAYEREGKTSSASGKLGNKPVEKMCLHFDENKMGDCAGKWIHRLDEEGMKENLEDAVKQMEREIQILKKRIEALDVTETDAAPMEKKEETTVTITIEDAVPGTLALEAFQFSPNPNDGKFNVSFDLPQKGRTVVRVFDSTNKEIYKEDLGKFSGRYSKQIDISDNPKGIYFLQVTQGDRAINKKIVIQ